MTTVTERERMLAEDKMLPLIMRFSIPTIVGMLVNALYNTVDRIYIGHKIGHEGIAGITVSFPIMVLMMAFSMLIGFGASSLLAIRLGEKKHDEVRTITGNSIVLFLIVSAVLTTLGLIFMKPLLTAFGASKDIMPYAKDYLGIVVWGATFQTLGFGMNNQVRALGSPKVAMLTMFVGAGINIVLDPIFIYVFNWGMKGAAFATVLSMMASAIWVMIYLFGKNNDLSPKREHFKLKGEVVKKMLAMGTPPFVMQIVASGYLIIMNKTLVNLGGDIALSAMGIAHSVNNLIMMPVFGLNQGVQPVIGYNYGAKNFDRVRSAVKTGMGLATAFVSVGFLMAMLIPKPLVMLFNSDDMDLINASVKVVRIFNYALPFVGFQIIGSGFFQSTGKPRQSTSITLIRQLVILIPLVLILPRIWNPPLDGVFHAIPISDFLATFLSAAWVGWHLKNLEKQHPDYLLFKNTGDHVHDFLPE